MDNKNLINLETELIARIMVDTQLRREITKQNHYWFFHIYFSRHVTYKTADFQKEMFMLTQDQKNELVVITGFRACAKTTIMVESYPVWAMVGILQKKNVLIICRTIEQAKKRLGNIKNELENNKILSMDLGPFKEEPPSDQWSASTLVLPKYGGARISAVSCEQNIRGTKSGPDRPDLVILDDIDDLNSVRTLESRNKTFDWLMHEVFPIGDKDVKFVIIGNLLHEDSMIARMKKLIESKCTMGIYREYPIVKNDKILWPGKYPTMADVEKENRGDEAAFQREYFLKIIPKHRIIHPEWIQYYDNLPPKDRERFVATSIDPASTTGEKSDYTAMVSFRVFSIKGEYYIYVLTNPIHIKVEHPELVDTAKRISKLLGNGIPTMVYVESVAYQRVISQDLQRDSYPSEDVPLSGLDKESRLKLASHKIKDGHILFPKQGCEQLIKEIVNFGATEHDDLVDAFTLGIMKLNTFQEETELEIYVISPPYHR